MSSKSVGQTTREETQHETKQKLHKRQKLLPIQDHGVKASYPQMTRKRSHMTKGEQEQLKRSKSVLPPSPAGNGEKGSLLSISHIEPKKQNQMKQDIFIYSFLSNLNMISPSEITSQQFDYLKIHLSNLFHSPSYQWASKVSQVQSAIAKISEANHDCQIRDFCQRMKQLLVPELKWRSSPQIEVIQQSIEDENEQTFRMVSQFVKTHNGAVMNRSDQMSILCYKGAECCQTIECCSLVTGMTRVETEDKVMATLSNSKNIIIISSMGSQLLNIGNSYPMISHVEGSTFVGSSMYSRILYLVDWKIKLNDGIIHEFQIKDYPSDIAVGPCQHILTTFAYISCVACYNLKGDLLFKLDSISGLPLEMPTHIFANRSFFYFIESEGKRINRVSALGGVSQVKIPIAANNMAIDKHTIALWDSFGQSHILETGEHFWPNQIYFHQAQTPTVDRQVYIGNTTDVKAVLMLSDSRLLLAYWSRQIELIDTDDIEKALLDSLELNSEPTAFCRWNQTQILVSFSENKIIQFISWEGDSLENKSQLNIGFGYVQVTSKATNEVVGLTVGPQPQVHMIFTTEGQVTIIAIIHLEHSNVSIAASPVNLLVADTDNCKLLFYSFCGKQLSVNKLKIKHRPWLVYSDGSHFYVVSASKTSVDCYNICGHFEQEFELASCCLPQIDVLTGTLSIVDTLHSRVLFYQHHNWDRCQVEVKNNTDSDIRSIDIRYGKRQEKKAVIGAMCLLLDGQIAIADWGEFQLFLISRDGDIVKQHPLPSLVTDICRWGNSQFGAILPLEKQLWLVGCFSFSIQVISLAESYIRVCQFDDTRVVCYCDRPSRLDLVTVKEPSQGTVTNITDSPDYIKSIAVRHDTKDILTWDSSRLLSYNITNNSPKKATLFQQTQSLLGGGCTDETLLYVTDKRHVFSLTGNSQVITEHFSGEKLGVIDQVDVLSGCVIVTELLSSRIYFQDLTVTERGHHYTIPRSSEDTIDIDVADVVITDNNLIVVSDKYNQNLKILTFKGMLLGILPLECPPSGICQWTPNTLAVILPDTNTLLTVKVQFPLSYIKYNTGRYYVYIAALSDRQLVCSWQGQNYQSGVDIIINIETLTNHCIMEIEGKINGVAVIQDIIAVASCKKFGSKIPVVFSFFSCSGEKLYEVDHLISQIIWPYSITSDNTGIYVTALLAKDCPSCIVCLSHKGRYNRIFLHHIQRIIPNSEGSTIRVFRAIDCRGPRVVVSIGHKSDSLYVQGLAIDRDTFPISRLQGDMSPVKIKDLDISVQGNTIMCDMVNNFIKLFTCDGQLIRHKSILAGGVCFMSETCAMVTIPHTSQLFSLDVDSLDIVKRWNTQIPYGRIRRLDQNLFLCFHINLTELHAIKVVGDTLQIMAKSQIFNQYPKYPFSLTLDMTENKKEETDSEDGTDSTGRNRGTDREHKLYSHRSQQNDSRQELWAKCSNYIASSRVGSDTISVIQLPWRTSQFSLPTKVQIQYNNIVYVALLTDDTIVISDKVNKTITLTTLKGHTLHKIDTDTRPWDVCQWTDNTFIVTFHESKSLVFYDKNYPLSPIRTISTEKGYKYICKNKNDHLICCTLGECYMDGGVIKYRGAYMDILSVTTDSVIYERSTAITDGLIFDISVTEFSVVVLKGIVEMNEEGYSSIKYFLSWYTGQLLHQYKQIPLEVGTDDPIQIAIHRNEVYLLAISGEQANSGTIYHISPANSCELYLTGKHTDCEFINGIAISESRLIITGINSLVSILFIRVYDM